MEADRFIYGGPYQSVNNSNYLVKVSIPFCDKLKELITDTWDSICDWINDNGFQITIAAMNLHDARTAIADIQCNTDAGLVHIEIFLRDHEDYGRLEYEDELFLTENNLQMEFEAVLLCKAEIQEPEELVEENQNDLNGEDAGTDVDENEDGNSVPTENGQSILNGTQSESSNGIVLV